MSLQAPKDMQRERASASFNIEALSHFWMGGKEKFERRRKALEFIEKDAELVVQAPRNILEFGREEMREYAMGQINRIVRLGREINDREFLEDISRAVILYSESFALRIGVHEALFRNVVQMLGNKQQQEEWIENVNEFKIIGCFAMTELGHSSALRDIETTATFDVETDEFIIHSPNITSTKWWIGMAGQTATHTVVIAQTLIHGKNVGLNWFIVQLRDTVTGKVVPGVQAGDVGSKVGHQGVDNGWIQFNQKRVPRTNMLAKWVSMDRSGAFQPAPNPAVMYATLIPERFSLVTITLTLVTQALTIATRYGVVRRQGSKNQQIMDYQSHYVKLLPAISFMYMVQNSFKTLDDQFAILTAGGEMDPIVYLNHMGDMHSISASLKGLSGAYATEILEICRRSCGGHAYSAYNALGNLISDFGVMTTGGGDNVVLLQQAARYLLYRLSQKLEFDEYPELKYQSATHYIARAKELLQVDKWSVNVIADATKDFALIEEALHVILLNSIQQALNDGATHNDLLLESVRVAELHCAAFLFSVNARQFASVPGSDVDPSVQRIMRQMTALWGLHILRVYGDQGYMEGFLSPKQMKDIEKEYLELCKSMRYQVIGLTDGFGLPDFVLKAPIAKYDGNIYQAYFETLLQAPASTGVAPYHAKLIKPLTERFESK
ncbi:acyl-CoA dehydrogenase/oxidase [Mucor lusitanicus]|uniref:Acyl-coenzyme A oxidase n=1 Tax=Mucor circinelloides f. lusitanicus TaxID=29924 RepID=A0A8H4F506_MUCCL|nr:acyl-CoA dehydrogenase/oxidase [Mucor lusitanicus]